MIPVFIFIGLYIVLDPFHVIYKTGIPQNIGFNKNAISTNNFDRNYKKYYYDSFIFGSSRSICFKAEEWKKHLNPHAKVYHFDSSAETLSGIVKKIKYIESKGITIKNAIICIDPEMLNSTEQPDEYLYIEHPALTPEFDFLKFHALMFKTFCNRQFLSTYLDFKINGIKDYMLTNNMITNDYLNYNEITNEVSYPEIDSLIARNPEQYYTPERIATFHRTKSDSVAPSFINSLKTLQICCNVKIIIMPVYNQIKINPIDLEYLKSKFYGSNVFDYSGKNKFTEDYHSYYDVASHPRPEICTTILNEVYPEKKPISAALQVYLKPTGKSAR